MTSQDPYVILRRIELAILEKEPDAQVIFYESPGSVEVLVLIDRPEITIQEWKTISDPVYDIELETEVPVSLAIRSKNEREIIYKKTGS